MMTGTAKKAAPAAAEAPEQASLEEQIEHARRRNELLRLEVEGRKLRAVLADLDAKATPRTKEL